MEIINSVTDTIKERTKNPFFGTLILVWLFRNWEVVFAIFNFERNFGLQEKLTFIKNFYKDKNLWSMFFENIGFALALMIIGYSFVILTRFIVSIVEHKWMPRIDEFADNKRIVTKERFNDVKLARDKYAQDNEDLQESLIQSQQKVNALKLEGELSAKEMEGLNSQLTLLKETKNEIENHRLELERENATLTSKAIGLEHNVKLLGTAIDSLQKNKFEFVNSAISYLKGLNISQSRTFGIEDIKMKSDLAKLESNAKLEKFLKIYETMFVKRSRVTLTNEDALYFKRVGLIEIHEDVLTSTAAGDMVYLLAHLDLDRRRGMGLN